MIVVLTGLDGLLDKLAIDSRYCSRYGALASTARYCPLVSPRYAPLPSATTGAALPIGPPRYCKSFSLPWYKPFVSLDSESVLAFVNGLVSEDCNLCYKKRENIFSKFLFKNDFLCNITLHYKDNAQLFGLNVKWC